MLGAASGNVGSRNGAADGNADATAGAAAYGNGKADATAGATAGAAVGAAVDAAADPNVKVDKVEALLRNCAADIEKVQRKRQRDEMQHLEDMHVLDIEERLHAEKTKNDEVNLEAQDTIKRLTAELSTQLRKISQQDTEISAHVATIATNTQTLIEYNDDLKRLQEDNTALRDKMQSSQNLCAQLHALMNPVHAQPASSATSCRQEHREHLSHEALQCSQQNMFS